MKHDKHRHTHSAFVPPQPSPTPRPEGETLPRIQLHPVAVRRYTVPRCGSVEARLWRLSLCGAAFPGGGDCRYAVELTGLGMRRFCLLVGGESRAHALLALLARHTVTPCALRDVLEEL